MGLATRLILFVVAALLSSTACSDHEIAAADVTGAPWEEADALFRSDPRWLGGDGAASLPLASNRILWLFGDSLVLPGDTGTRRDARMIRNCIAIQNGPNPSTATIQFYWKNTDSAPAGFFPDEGPTWSVPSQGIRHGDSLLVFLTQFRAVPGRGKGFETTGFRMAVIGNVNSSPDTWSPRLVAPTAFPQGLAVGGSVLNVGDQTYALAIRDPGDRAGFLVRWRTEALAAGAIDDGEIWTGKLTGFAPFATGFSAMAPLLQDAGPESSLHFDTRLRRFVHVKSLGANTLALAFAPRLEGPWTQPQPVYRPPESTRKDTLVYAGKGHPELDGADLVLTYATTARAGFDALVDDASLFYPRFVRINFRAP